MKAARRNRERAEARLAKARARKDPVAERQARATLERARSVESKALRALHQAEVRTQGSTRDVAFAVKRFLAAEGRVQDLEAATNKVRRANARLAELPGVQGTEAARKAAKDAGWEEVDGWLGK